HPCPPLLYLLFSAPSVAPLRFFFLSHPASPPFFSPLSLHDALPISFLFTTLLHLQQFHLLRFVSYLLHTLYLFHPFLLHILYLSHPFPFRMLHLAFSFLLQILYLLLPSFYFIIHQHLLLIDHILSLIPHDQHGPFFHHP